MPPTRYLIFFMAKRFRRFSKIKKQGNYRRRTKSLPGKRPSLHQQGGTNSKRRFGWPTRYPLWFRQPKPCYATAAHVLPAVVSPKAKPLLPLPQSHGRTQRAPDVNSVTTTSPDHHEPCHKKAFQKQEKPFPAISLSLTFVKTFNHETQS